jgi:hypothetical protein
MKSLSVFSALWNKLVCKFKTILIYKLFHEQHFFHVDKRVVDQQFVKVQTAWHTACIKDNGIYVFVLIFIDQYLHLFAKTVEHDQFYISRIGYRVRNSGFGIKGMSVFLH